MIRKIVAVVVFILCAVFAFARAHEADSPADREERIFTFYHALAANLRAAQGHPLEAAQMFDEMARHTGNASFARAAVEAAEAAGEYELAAQYAETWKKLGGDVEAQISAAAVAIHLGDLPAAESMLRDLAEQGALSPSDMRRILAVADDQNAALADAGDQNAALAAAEDQNAALAAARRLFADDPDSQYQLGLLALQFNRADVAENILANAAADASKPEPHFVLALVAETRDNTQSAFAGAVAKLDDYREKGCPGAAPARCEESYVMLAYRLFSLQTRRRPAPDWRGILSGKNAAFGLQERARLAAGQTLEQAGLPLRATRHYGEVRPGDYYFQARLGLARIARDNGDQSLALDILDETPASGEWEFIRRELTAADILRNLDGAEAAARRTAKARETFPNHSELLYMHSLYAEQSGDVALAVSLLERMTALYPRDPDGWNALGYVMADHGMNLPAARAHITRALRMKPDDPNILDSLGWVHYRLGNLELARRHLEEAMKRSDALEIAAHLGEVLWELGEREAAREVWRRALERDGENAVLAETLARYRPF